jgi:hypothetical protein
MTEVSEKVNASTIILMMEAISSSDTSVNIHQTTQCYVPQDSHLRVPHNNDKT